MTIKKLKHQKDTNSPIGVMGECQCEGRRSRLVLWVNANIAEALWTSRQTDTSVVPVIWDVPPQITAPSCLSAWKVLGSICENDLKNIVIRIVQKPRVEPDMTGKTNNKNNEIIPKDVLLYSDWRLVQSSLERLPPAADGGKHNIQLF